MIFSNTIKLERLRGKDEWVLIEDVLLILDDGRQILVPRGFVTDKASVPRPVWWLIPRDDKYIIDAALIHDWLYMDQKIDGEWIERITADKIFADIASFSGMGWIRQRLAYRGVRLGGWHYFNPRAKAQGNPYYA